VQIGADEAARGELKALGVKPDEWQILPKGKTMLDQLK
jgi:hypothetical protein